MRTVIFVVVAMLGVLCGANRAWAKQCPGNDPSVVRTIEGKLTYHDGLRHWFELVPDKPVCGESSIQLIASDDDRFVALGALRGCRVASTGQIEFSPTGYYSLTLFVDVKEVQAVGQCEQQPRLYDPPAALPDPKVETYQVDMEVDYGPGDHPVVIRIISEGEELNPSRDYASYFLTGSSVLYGYCGTGFLPNRAFATPEAGPGIIDDAAAFDLESAVEADRAKMTLGYICVRVSQNPK